MSQKKDTTKIRLYVLIGAVVAVLIWFTFTMYSLQILHGSEYRADSLLSNASKETVTTNRGIVTDRNGTVLISNRTAYDLVFSKADFPEEDADSAMNDAIFRALTLCAEHGISGQDSLPLSASTPWQILDPGSTFTAFCEKEKLSTANGLLLLDDLRELFGIADTYTDTEARRIAGVRYELHGRDSCVLASDVSVSLLSQVADGNYAGLSMATSSKRVYHTASAGHLLGRIAPIYKEDWDYYADLNYPMNALVGESGVEKAFEQYLHGTDGTRLLSTDETGRVVSEIYLKQPKPGATVSLTLDIDLQEATEKALASTIESMIDADSNERGGAAVVTQVGTGDILAMASYPSYDPASYNSSYEELLADERLPLFNRAADGIYAPGSTFKMVTAVAALENGIVTPQDTVRDRGRYTFYDWPQPMCWAFATGYTHGLQNVRQAITNSCNYYFYEVGRLTGIDAINDYAKQFGLGSPTGIETGESSGALASPEYAAQNNLDWTEGQVITAAIGQSYNLFTPLQLSSYIATLVGGGERYETHLLKSVRSHDNSTVLYTYDEGPTNTVEMSEETLSTITAGMHDLTKGSLAGAFADCVVEAGAKTGSAQVGTDIANGVFVAYAPYDDPEIAVSIVIEKGGAGAALASTAVEIINAYYATNSDTPPQGENTLRK